MLVSELLLEFFSPLLAQMATLLMIFTIPAFIACLLTWYKDMVKILGVLNAILIIVFVSTIDYAEEYAKGTKIVTREVEVQEIRYFVKEKKVGKHVVEYEGVFFNTNGDTLELEKDDYEHIYKNVKAGDTIYWEVCTRNCMFESDSIHYRLKNNNSDEQYLFPH